MIPLLIFDIHAKPVAAPVEFGANDRLDSGFGGRLREFHRAVEIVFVGQRNCRKIMAFGQLNDCFGG